jgi:hypothetical protein
MFELVSQSLFGGLTVSFSLVVVKEVMALVLGLSLVDIWSSVNRSKTVLDVKWLKRLALLC